MAVIRRIILTVCFLFILPEILFLNFTTKFYISFIFFFKTSLIYFFHRMDKLKICWIAVQVFIAETNIMLAGS